MYTPLLLAALLPIGQVSALYKSPPRHADRRPASLAVSSELVLPADVGQPAAEKAHRSNLSLDSAAEQVPHGWAVAAPPSAVEFELKGTPIVTGLGNSSATIVASTGPWKSTDSYGPWIDISSSYVDNGWISRVRQWHERINADAGVWNFFQSAMRIEWLVFAAFLLLYIALHTYLFDWPSSRTYHALALFIWLGAASLYNMVIWFSHGAHPAKTWFVGYILEFIFSIENVFIYHIVVQAFQVPRKPAQKALFVVILLQMAFQMVFFMGLASWLRSIYVLPYILGAWLVYVGVESARESDHAKFDCQETAIFRACKWLLGSRLSLTYRDDNSVVFTENGRTKFTLLLPAIGALLLVDFIMEVDVTLTKIAEIRNPYMGFTSSVAAAFAVPELFFVARDMFKRFALLKYGVSFVLLFFGGQLLLHRWVHCPDLVGIALIAVVLAICVVLSVLTKSRPKHRREECTTDESEVERQAKAQWDSPNGTSHSSDHVPAEVREDSARLPAFPEPREPQEDHVPAEVREDSKRLPAFPEPREPQEDDLPAEVREDSARLPASPEPREPPEGTPPPRVDC